MKEFFSKLYIHFSEPDYFLMLLIPYLVLSFLYKTKTPPFDGVFAVMAYLIFASALLSGTAIRLAMTHFAKSMRIKTEVRVMMALSRSDWV